MTVDDPMFVDTVDNANTVVVYQYTSRILRSPALFPSGCSAWYFEERLIPPVFVIAMIDAALSRGPDAR